MLFVTKQRHANIFVRLQGLPASLNLGLAALFFEELKWHEHAFFHFKKL